MIDETTIQDVLAEGLRRGGDFVEVFAEDRWSSTGQLDDGRVETFTSGRSRGAGVRVVAGETVGFAHTADLSAPALRQAVEAAAAVARAGEGEARPVALHEGVVTETAAVEIGPDSVPKATKAELLVRADDAARSTGDSVRQVSAGYADSRRRILVANTDGLLASDEQTRVRAHVMAVATGDTGMQTGLEVVAGTVGFELLGGDAIEEAARTAARRAITKLDARPAPSGVLPVVVKRGSGGVLFHEACGHGLEADLVGKGASVYRDRTDEQVASPLVTLVDDGTVSGEWGALGIDDEGRPTARNVLIENGVLGDYMWDFLRARKDGRASSGNGRRQSYQHLPMVRMTNTYVLPGDDDPDEIVAQTERGVYLAKLGGGQVDTASGDFVFGMTEAYLIEDGRITAPIRDANLIGNGPEVLRNIDAVGDDFGMIPGTCGKDGQSVPVGCGQPTLRITGVTIGGTAQ